MPTIDRIGPYRFFFYSNEASEPSHVHVQRESMVAKFWLNPVAYVNSSGFSAHELNNIEAIVVENSVKYLEAWNEYFK